MNIKINTNISSKFKETSITINTPESSDEIQNIIKYISNINTMPNQIIASRNNEIYFIDIEKIICFSSKDKYTYARTINGTYKTKYRLYELEDIFNQKDFIRISKSCIININQVECFNISMSGTIIVKLKDNTQEIVSKRNLKQIMKVLKERGRVK